MIRICCIQVDAGDAIHIGGPPVITAKTFDIEAPEIERWLSTPIAYGTRSVSGVEIVTKPLTGDPSASNP